MFYLNLIILSSALKIRKAFQWVDLKTKIFAFLWIIQCPEKMELLVFKTIKYICKTVIQNMVFT
jgi:hypothetical protein